MDGAVDAVDEPSEEFFGGVPSRLPFVHFCLGDGVFPLVLSDFRRGKDGMCPRDEGSGEFCEVLGGEIIGDGTKIVDKDFEEVGCEGSRV